MSNQTSKGESQNFNKSPIIRVTSAQSVESNRSGPLLMQHQGQRGPEREMATSAGNDRGTSNDLAEQFSVKSEQIPLETNADLNNNNKNNDVNKDTKIGDEEVDGRGQIQAHKSGTLARSSSSKDERTHAYGMRWFVLAIFCSHSAINSFQWIQYAAITNIVTTYYGVTNLEVNLTSLIYMITYIPFIIHASLMLEHVGLRTAICLGAAGTATGSLIKLFLGYGPTPSAFWGMMLGQTIVALSQLYIISIPPLLAAVWFPDHQVSTATGIGVFGNQLGIALGFIVPPLWMSTEAVSKERLGNELNSLAVGVAVVSVAICLLAFACLKDKPPKPPGSASLHAEQQHKEHQAAAASSSLSIIEANGSRTEEDSETFASIKELCRERDFRLLALSYGLNVGCFYALSTVLNQMLARNWEKPDDMAGVMGMLIVVSGMAGSVMCGQLLDRTHAYKLIIVLIYLMSLVSMIFFTIVLRMLSSPWPLFIASIILGFFTTGYLPLGFEFAAEITYPHLVNTPAGLLNLSAQVFGLVLTYASSLIVDTNNGDLWANVFLSFCLAIGLIQTAMMKANLKRQKAVAEEQMKI